LMASAVRPDGTLTWGRSAEMVSDAMIGRRGRERAK
jgi:hypothetical protein